MIRENPEKDKVFDLRLNYQFYKSQRLPDGQITHQTCLLPSQYGARH